jgi:chromosome segregation ATPase
LESVLRAYPDNYSDLAAISQRHNVLIKSKRKLEGDYDSVMKEIGRMKDEIKQYEKDKNREIITLNTDVATLQERLDKIETKKSKLENQVQTASESVLDENLELGRVLMAIDNIFSRCEDGIKYIKEDPKKQQDENKKTEEKKKEEAMKAAKSGKNPKDATPAEDVDDFNKKCKLMILLFIT